MVFFQDFNITNLSNSKLKRNLKLHFFHVFEFFPLPGALRPSPSRLIISCCILYRANGTVISVYEYNFKIKLKTFSNFYTCYNCMDHYEPVKLFQA